MSKHITSSSTGQILAVTFCAKRRTKSAIQNLRGELSVIFLKGNRVLMFYRSILFFLLLLQVAIVHAQSKITFTAEPEIQKIAEEHVRVCIKTVKEQYKIELDGSDSSVLSLEPILDHLSNYVKAKGMPQKRLIDYARIYGFYIGETYRKNHGGVSWGLVNIDGQDYFGLGKTETNEAFIWPVASVLKRIHMGPEANIATYYTAITEK